MPEAFRLPLRLFVYGSLMPGHYNHCRIEPYVRCACSGRIKGVLVDLGAFPALVPGIGIVDGVLLEVDAAAMAVTDLIEGYMPGRNHCLYYRKEVVVDLDDHTQVLAWTYQYADPHRILDRPRCPAMITASIPVYAWHGR